MNDQYEDPHDRTRYATTAQLPPAPTLDEVLRLAGEAWATSNAPFTLKLDPLTAFHDTITPGVVLDLAKRYEELQAVLLKAMTVTDLKEVHDAARFVGRPFEYDPPPSAESFRKSTPASVTPSKPATKDLFSSMEESP